MKRYVENDIVKITKSEDKYEGKYGQIVDVIDLIHVPVTIYIIKFDNERKGYYFFSEIWK